MAATIYRDAVPSISLDPQPWMADANCKGTDPEIFFERTKSENPPAKKYCSPCTVKRDCVVFALLTENPLSQRYGYFGDTSPGERKALYDTLTKPKEVEDAS